MYNIRIYRLAFDTFFRHFVIRPDKWQKVNRVKFTCVLRLRAPRQDASLFALDFFPWFL